MRTLKIKIESTSPIMYSRFYGIDVPMKNKEAHDEYEKRTWKSRLHTDEDGFVILPPDSPRQAIMAQAQRMSIKKKGPQTYTKDFKSGLLMEDERIYLLDPDTGERIHKDSVQGSTKFVPSNGQSGGGKRVMKTFPIIERWIAEFGVHILDDGLPSDIVESVVAESGRFTGLGAMRPANGGTCGRYKILEKKWK